MSKLKHERLYKNNSSILILKYLHKNEKSRVTVRDICSFMLSNSYTNDNAKDFLLRLIKDKSVELENRNVENKKTCLIH